MNELLAWIIIGTVVIWESIGIGCSLTNGNIGRRPFWYLFGEALLEISAVWLAIRILIG